MIRAVGITPIDYAEVAFNANGSVRLQRQHRVNQIADGPDAIGDAERDRWCGPQGFMDTAKVVVRQYRLTAAA